MTAQRNQSLDVLRAIAVLLVLGVHVPHYRIWAHIGWAGVDLFFVLSGFLISGLLFRDYQEHGSIDWKRFLIRRGFKIYPSYYIFLAIAGVVLASVAHRDNARIMLLGNAVFVGNYFQHIVLNGPFGHLWSIAVEEHFYVFLPALLISLSRLRRRNPFAVIPWLFVALACVCLALRVFELNPREWIFQTHLRMDSLFAGVTLGYVYHFRRDWFAKLSSHWTLAAAAALCLPTLIATPNSYFVRTVGLTTICLGFALLVAWSVDRIPRSKIGRGVAKSLAAIGFYSYSIYLWHSPVALTFAEVKDSAFSFWLYISLSLALGILMAKLIELPALALRERLFPADQRVSAFQNRRFPIMITSTMLPSLAHVGGVESSDRSK